MGDAAPPAVAARPLRPLPAPPLGLLLTALRALVPTGERARPLSRTATLVVGAPVGGGPLRLVDGTATAGLAPVLERPRASAALQAALHEADRTEGEEWEAASSWMSVLAPFLLSSSTTPSDASPLQWRLHCRRHRRRRAALADGHGRFTVMLSTALQAMQRSCADDGDFAYLRGLFLPQQSPRVSASLLDGLPAEEARACRRLVHTLHRLSRDGGVTVRSCPDSEDWLHAVARSAREQLRGSGDWFALSDHIRVPFLAEGVLHHVLATEVEGAALEALRRVLMDYLFGMSAGDGGNATTAPQRLAHLLRHPERVFLCPPASLAARGMGVGGASSPFTTTVRVAAAATKAAPCDGPVDGSQVVPGNVVVLSLEEDETDGRGSAGAARWWSLPPITTASSSAPPPPPHASCRKVLLVRIDPAGEWLPAEEDRYNTQTFFSFYENDLREQQEQHACERGALAAARRGANGWAAEPEEEETFEGMASRMAGRREVAHQPDDQVPDAWSQVASRNEEEELLDRLLSPSTGGGIGGKDLGLLRASLRLLLFAVQHGVDVIVTPEKAPHVLRSAGQRYLPVLRALTQTTQGGGDAVHVVDCVRLQDFLSITCLGKTGGDGGGICQPLLLSRDSLRAPAPAPAATTAQTGPVLCVSRVFLTPSNVLVRHRLSGTSACDAAAPLPWERLVPPAHLPMKALGSRRVCLVIVFPTSASPPPPPAPAPLILLATPSAALSERYTHLLLKGAAVLAEAMAVSVPCEEQWTGGVGLTAGGVVRAGGAALVAASRALHALAHATPRGSGGAVAGMDAVERKVLRMLAEACASVPSALAEGVFPVAQRASGRVGQSRWLRGPRARRRLWNAALTWETTASDGRVGRPVLHVYVPTARELAARLASSGMQDPTDDTAADPESGEESVHHTALRVFASDLRGSHGCHGGVGASSGLPFVESFEGNLSLLRAVTQALHLILTAAAGPAM